MATYLGYFASIDLSEESKALGASRRIGPCKPPEGPYPGYRPFAPDGLKATCLEKASAMPRPRKEASATRQLLVKLRLNEEEHRYLSTAAKLAGLPLASFIRQAALGAQLKVKPTRDQAQLVRQLTAIGNNLNQIARHANQTGDLVTKSDLQHVLNRVVEAIRRI